MLTISSLIFIKILISPAAIKDKKRLHIFFIFFASLFSLFRKKRKKRFYVKTIIIIIIMKLWVWCIRLLFDFESPSRKFVNINCLESECVKNKNLITLKLSNLFFKEMKKKISFKNFFFCSQNRSSKTNFNTIQSCEGQFFWNLILRIWDNFFGWNFVSIVNVHRMTRLQLLLIYIGNADLQ